MKNKLFVCVLLLILIFWSGGCTPSSSGDDQQAGKENPMVKVNKLPEFQAADLEGNEVTNTVFNDYDVTMINIWGTFCGPCIAEMPDIQRISEDMQSQKVQVIGIVADQKLEEARTITAEQGATYLNLMPDQSLIDNLLSKFDYVPATVFVNSEGEFYDVIVSGSRDYNSYREIIEGLLSE